MEDRNTLFPYTPIPYFLIPLITISFFLGSVKPGLASLLYRDSYQARCDSIIDYYANRISASDLSNGHYIDIAAKLFRNRDLKWCTARLNTLQKNPRGDMFWMYQFTTTTFAGRNVLPDSIKLKMRDLWRTYTPYRGDTENHWAMYYSALYLIAQMYPEQHGKAWFNGKNSRENFEEALEYLLEWINMTTRIGQGEYDSPHYLPFFIIPMAQIYAWAEDEDMKRRAQMMLDYLIADFAVENLNGIYTGAHSRIYPLQVKQQDLEPTTGLAWLLFGNTTFRPHPSAFLLAISGYEPPEILYNIATDRAEPYIHKERKRTRHRIRFSDLRNAPVYKYTYMTLDFALGSSQGGLLQPIQQHTWDLTWRNQNATGTLFTLHPYSSPHELGMYFSEQLDFVTEIVVRSKKTYDSPNKWTGGSPYEQVFQHKNILIALYDIPEGTRFPHINGFFSKALTARIEDESGWIFARTSSVLIAYYPLAPYHWIREDDGNWRLHSDELRNGAVVLAAPVTARSSFVDFQNTVRALPLQARVSPKPAVKITSPLGDEISFAYDECPIVNAKYINYEEWKLFEGPFLFSEVGSQILDIRHGNLRRRLDFKKGTIENWIVK